MDASRVLAAVVAVRAIDRGCKVRNANFRVQYVLANYMQWTQRSIILKPTGNRNNSRFGPKLTVAALRVVSCVLAREQRIKLKRRSFMKLLEMVSLMFREYISIARRRSALQKTAAEETRMSGCTHSSSEKNIGNID